MGRAAGAFGLKGEVKLTSFAQDQGMFLRAGVVFAGPDPARARPLSVISLRPHQGRLLLRLKEITNREQAQALGGAWVYLRREDLDPLQTEEYYWFELKDALVRTSDGRELGRVQAVTNHGAHDILVVRDSRGRELLIPVSQEVVKELDAAAGLVVIEPTPGLLECQDWEPEPA
jgi:16S rRNA processing protein RimM